jgi:hypothetical protein
MESPTGIVGLQVFLGLVWLTYKKTENPHLLFARYMPDENGLAELAAKIPLEFAPGLTDVVQSDTSPTIAYFKTLPSPGKSDRETIWAMYLLVLEKLGCRDLIYIGSATDSIRGTAPRWSNYDGLVQLPTYVQKAIDDGYTITHKGLLCQAPPPSSGLQPGIRGLFKGLEAMFTFALWAIRTASRDSWASLRDVPPWPVDSFQYGGLCSHNPFLEAILGDHDLSAEELEEYYEDMKDRRTTYIWDYRQSIKAADEEAYLGKARETRARFVKNNPESVKATTKRCKAKAVAEKRHYCEPCDHAFNRAVKLRVHLQGPKHAKQVRKLAAIAKMNAKSSTGSKPVVPVPAANEEPVTKISAGFKPVVPIVRGKQQLLTNFFTVSTPVAEAAPRSAGVAKQH